MFLLLVWDCCMSPMAMMHWQISGISPTKVRLLTHRVCGAVKRNMFSGPTLNRLAPWPRTDVQRRRYCSKSQRREIVRHCPGAWILFWKPFTWKEERAGWKARKPNPVGELVFVWGTSPTLMRGETLQPRPPGRQPGVCPGEGGMLPGWKKSSPLPSTPDRSPAVSAQNTCSGRRRRVPSGLCTGQQMRIGCREATAPWPPPAARVSPSSPLPPRGFGVGGLWRLHPRPPGALRSASILVEGACTLACPSLGVGSCAAVRR